MKDSSFVIVPLHVVKDADVLRTFFPEVAEVLTRFKGSWTIKMQNRLIERCGARLDNAFLTFRTNKWVTPIEPRWKPQSVAIKRMSRTRHVIMGDTFLGFTLTALYGNFSRGVKMQSILASDGDAPEGPPTAFDANIRALVIDNCEDRIIPMRATMKLLNLDKDYLTFKTNP